MLCFGKLCNKIMKRLVPFLILFIFLITNSCNKDEINELEKRNTELQEQISNLTIEINTLTFDISNLTSSNNQLTSSNNDLQNQIIYLRDIITELEEDLNNMTNDYEQAELENSDLYDEFLSILNSRNELQAQLDNLVNEINSISCPPINLASPSMMSEQLFCTLQYIDPLIFEFDESVFNLSFIQDSIPTGIIVSQTQGKIEVFGTPISLSKDLFSFDLKFTSDQCEEVKRITLARSPNSPTLGVINGSLNQSIVSGNEIEAIEFLYGGSSQGLTFSDLPEGLTYSIDGNKYKIEGTLSEVGTSSFTVSTVNTSGCGELVETINIDVEQAAIPSGGGGGGTPPVVAPPVQTPNTQFQLTVNTGDNGAVSPSGGTYNDGESVSITASPDTGYGFVNWTDSSGNELSTNPTYTFNITSDTTITANYEELLFYLHDNGVTILCPNASVGAVGSVNGDTYTKVDRDALFAKRNLGEDLSFVCTSGITDLSSLFRKQNTTNNASVSSDIRSWDTSDVESFSRIFANTDFNQDISNWDTGKVKNMYNAFQNAWEFNQDISGWNTENVENMRQTFRLAKKFNQDISGWNTISVNDMRAFLKQTEVFDQDLSDWNVDGVTQCDQFILNALSMSEDKIPENFTCNYNIENSSSNSN